MNSDTPRTKRGLGLAGAVLLLAPVVAQAATIELPPVKVGAGARAAFTSVDVDAPNVEDTSDFTLQSARIYLSGAITEKIKFTFNTEYEGDVTNDVNVMDAIAQFEFSPQFNIWAGRFLPPSDRANLYGPYYANAWGFVTDGIQDGYPFIVAGRDNGVAYWGNFNRLNVSFGVFDVPSTMFDNDPNTPNDGGDVVLAGRLHYSFWDIESGYYLNGTYYGDKDILSLGVAAQDVGSDSSVTVDLLLEKKIAGGGAATFEAEYADYEGQAGGYNAAGLAFTESDGFFVLGAYLFPQKVGMGQFQLLGKFADNDYEAATDFSQETTELNINYVIKQFNARLSLFYISQDFDDVAPTVDSIGLGLQVQM